jgi:hypothetical protein
MTIFNQTNRGRVVRELVNTSTKFKLKNKDIIQGTLYFSDRDIFETEVDSEDDITVFGEYWVDYLNGLVSVYSESEQVYVKYDYMIYPFVAMGSPVILSDIADEKYSPIYFDQIITEDGETINSTANDRGVAYINEVLSVNKTGFGK